MSASNASIARRRGVTGDLTRRVLEALREPGTVAILMDELSLLRADAWAITKHLFEQRRIERLKRGVYRITAAGEQALLPPATHGVHALKTQVRQAAPAGTSWTPERVTWLIRYFPALGHQRCGELLGIKSETCWAKANKLGLEFGDVPGYVLIVDLAALLDNDYTVLYSRAQRAGVLTFPKTVMDAEKRSKAMVPDAWADQIASERQPPEPDDVALSVLREQLGISKTQMARQAGPEAYLRTPVAGGQARLYTTAEAAERLLHKYREKAKRAPVASVGRAGVLAAITAHGAQGASERELYESLPCSRAAVRIHVHAMSLAGELDRCRLGDSIDPFVYRLTQFADQPIPLQRKVVLPGRPRKALAQAAD